MNGECGRGWHRERERQSGFIVSGEPTFPSPSAPHPHSLSLKQTSNYIFKKIISNENKTKGYSCMHCMIPCIWIQSEDLIYFKDGLSCSTEMWTWYLAVKNTKPLRSLSSMITNTLFPCIFFLGPFLCCIILARNLKCIRV